MKFIVGLLFVCCVAAIECNETMYVMNNTCVECDANCAAKCEDNYGCRTCSTGYFVNEGQMIEPEYFRYYDDAADCYTFYINPEVVR